MRVSRLAAISVVSITLPSSPPVMMRVSVGGAGENGAGMNRDAAFTPSPAT